MDSVKYAWKPRKFNYLKIAEKNRLKSTRLTTADYHPLKSITVTSTSALKVKHSDGKSTYSEAKGTKKKKEPEVADFVDPLSALTLTDPLSSSQESPAKAIKQQEDVRGEDESEDDFEPWTSREFVKLTMASASAKNVPKRYQSGASVSDKLKDRLGELDDFEEGGFMEMQNLNQQEFMERITMLNETLTEAWNENLKVKALKIAIQSAKLLGNTAIMQFYPSKFVLVTNLLDTFGSLVLRRIFSMCKGIDKDNIDADKVPENAREICMNWLLKIASIRELLPRIYIEAATLHCSSFLKIGESKSTLLRLTSMARGIGDPLVATYFRTYLCHVGQLYLPKFQGHLKPNLYDFIVTYKQVHTASVQNVMATQKLDMPTYLSLYKPALEWMISCLAHKAHEATLNEVTERCYKNISSLLLLNCCITAFNAEYVATRALSFCSIFNGSQDTLFPKYVVYQTLGEKVVKADPPEAERLPLLNEVWKVLVKIRNPEHYMACAMIWVEYVAKNFAKKEVNTVLNDIIKHLTPDRAFKRFYPQLKSVVGTILSHTNNFSDIFAMEKFLPFLDLFQKDERKEEVCQMIAESFISNQEQALSDPIAINGLMYVCKAMHDSINALSMEGKKTLVSSLVSGVVLKISFGKDFEQQLSFYVECRASFRGLDTVLACLVHAVNKLSAKVTSIVKGNHTRKTAAFVRACTAYSFITIPSLIDIHSRLLLYLESGQVALISQCITQADAMYKSAISMIFELASVKDSKSVFSQNLLCNFVTNFLSSLLTVPDNTEKGVLYLLRGLLNVISDSSAVVNLDTKCLIFIKVLSVLTAYGQDQYIYHVDKVDSNENLYSSDPKFLAEINSIGTTVLDEILGYLVSPVAPPEMKAQSACAFHLFETVMAHADLDDESMQHLAATSWGISNQDGQNKNAARMLAEFKKSGGVYQKIASVIQSQPQA
ncbi:unnamed protein product [Clavelina lepadiformis]|uniref:VPS35 endosomal protein-sorting factor-like n=1 Tax=Clavelina lepadiformis TaxID=159417 RepID=A0ABP0FXN3_CLALP